jgi:hypothetical protein
MAVMEPRYRGSREYVWVRQLLIGAARERTTVRYIPIARIMGLPDRGDHMARETGYMCGEISDAEHDAGRPMLSAVVISGARSGRGFFVLARALGLLATSSREGNDRFWQNELEAVYRHWASRV